MKPAHDRNDEAVLLEIADAINAGRVVAWDEVERSGPRVQRAVIRQLKALSSYISAHEDVYQSLDESAPADGSDTSRATVQSWGNLEVLEKIGSGAFGEVYRARDPQLDREVALKLLDAERLGRARSSSAVIEEGRLLARVKHPNVVTVYGAEERDGRVGIWMELIEGRTLADELAEDGLFEPAAAMRVGRDVSRALAALHEAGVLHRDIKARNVIRDPDDRIVLMDLGVSCDIDHETPVGLCGTPLYAAPEVLLEGNASWRSDIYNLGVLLYHLVTGLYPVSGRTLEEIRDAHRTGRRRFVRQLQPDLPDTLIRIIDQATSPNPEQRFASAVELEQALDWALGEELRDAVLIGSEVPSLAVLPFTDLSPQKDQGHLCDGLADELIDALIKLEGLKVAAYTSTLQVVRRGMDLRQIGARLKIRTVLEGSIRPVNDQLKITARLSQVSDGFAFWTETFVVQMQDPFEAQERIARAIVKNLKIEMLDARSGKLVKQYTQDVEAHNLYMQGHYYFRRRYEGGLQTALEYFQRASERDPLYPLPYVGIADCFNILSYFQFVRPHDGFSRVKSAAARALELDDSIGEAYASLGWCATFYDWDFAAAEDYYQQAIELSPHSGTTRSWYSMLLAGLGRFDESLAEARQAVALDPLCPGAGCTEGVVLNLARRHDEAVACLSRTVALHPDVPQTRTQYAGVCANAGLHAEAESNAAMALEADPGFPYALQILGYSYARSHRREKAFEVLARLEEVSRDRYVGPHCMAVIEGALGRIDRSFALLDEAYRERDPWLFWAAQAQETDVIRDDPRMPVLLGKIGLGPMDDTP